MLNSQGRRVIFKVISFADCNSLAASQINAKHISTDLFRLYLLEI